MRTKVTLFLVFLNVALFFYIFKFERHWQTERELVEKGSLVLGATAANLQLIQISGPAVPTPVDLRRQAADGWLLTKPIVWPANPFAVNSLLTALERLEHETSFSAEESELAKNRVTLATYGLAEPRLTVTFSANESGAGALSLQVGAATPDGKRLYVLSPDRKWIHVVSNRLAEVLIKPADQLRSDALFSIGATEVKGLNIRAAATQPNRIERDAANRWQFLSPVRARANDQATLRAVTGLANLRVKSFPPPPPADALTANLRVTLQGNNRTEILNVGAPVARAAAPESTGDTEYYATLETTRNNQPATSAPFTVVLPATLENLLQKSTQELRERRLFADLDARAVTAIGLSGGGAEALTLQRLEAGPGALPSWHVVQGAGAAAANTPSADPAVIDRLLARLLELVAVDFVTEAPSGADLENWGFNRPERVITLNLGTGQPPRRLELGYDRDRQKVRAHFASGDSPTIFEVRPEIVDDASLRPLDYRNRLIRELPSGGAARLTRLRLTQESNQAVLLNQNLADPAGPVPAAVTELLPQLQSLRAESFVADAFGPTVRVDNADRPWAYKLEMDIALVAGVGATQTTTTTLMLSERTGGTVQFAGAEEFRAIWRLPQALIDPLWRIISAPTDPGAPGRGR